MRKYIEYTTADGDVKNMDVTDMTEDQITDEMVFLANRWESGWELPMTNIHVVISA